MATKETSPRIARAASHVLTSPSTGAASRTAAASALAQTASPERETSAAAATAASEVLRDGRTSKESKSAAASALAQRRKR